ncbi:MAG: nitrate/nitrite transporter [Pseudomonadales bacterium]
MKLTNVDQQRLTNYMQVLMLALAVSVIYSMPYLRQIFKSSLLDVFQLSETQLGNLSSTYALSCMICYLPGGWLADKVAPKKLVIIALLSSSATYFWYASIPSYQSLVIIYALWGVIGVGVLWSAMLKQTNLLGGKHEQGRMFGVLEGTRGLFEAILMTVASLIFAWYVSKSFGMQTVIIVYAVLCIVIAVIMMFTGENNDSNDADAYKTGANLKDILAIIKLPSVWLLCIILSAVYHIFWATIELPSFAENGGFGMALAAVMALGTTKLWMRPIGGIVGGFLGDKYGNDRMMCGSFLAGVAACAFLATMPTTAASSWMLWVFIVPFGILAYALRGLIWALLEDCPIPKTAIGSAIGLISVVGYSPDLYVPQINSYLLSNYSMTEGYQLFFAYIACASGVGALATWALMRHRQNVATAY